MYNNKLISPFIAEQFPSFYLDDGINFVAFITAYYEWMEQPGNPIYEARSLLEYNDVDITAQQFLTNFKDKYINSIPENIISDKRLLIKHILDLYRTKGTPRAYHLLFRILFNEDMDLYIPGDFLLKPSDNKWTIPRYIELTDSPYLNSLVGKQIKNSSSTASAIVENYTKKIINNKVVSVLFLTSMIGRFKYQEKILCNDVPNMTIDVAPTILGSLTGIAIENGGYGFSVGDIVDIVVSNQGTIGKARISSVRDENGKVEFDLLSGGTGYSLNPTITVLPTLTIGIQSTSNNNFIPYETVTNSNTFATGIVSPQSNTSTLVIFSFSNSSAFFPADVVSSPTSNAIIKTVSGGGGAGATFSIGGIVNKEIYQINTDLLANYVNTQLNNDAQGMQINITSPTGTFTTGNTVTSSANVVILNVLPLSSNVVTNGETLSNTALGISNLYVYKSDQTLMSISSSVDSQLTNANLVSGVILVSNVTNSLIQLVNCFEKESKNSNGLIVGSNTSQVTISVSTGEFIPPKILTDTATGHTATISSVALLTDWHFPASPHIPSNLDSIIGNVLIIISLEVGTISYITNVNPGTGYNSDPYVDVNETSISSLNISDNSGNGGQKGHNAIIRGKSINANGIVTSTEIVESGFGFTPETTIYLQKNNNPVAVSGSPIIELDGKSLGGYSSNKSFLSDNIVLQDSDYYQQFSYEIIAARMIDTYKNDVKTLIHPSGVKLFGRHRLTSIIENPPSVLSFESIVQTP